ncbi:hypothetical protein C1H46_031350 [Malus baccata]|uniref:Uncharacterized protein n=1 Tax=Malus baccata TaxID=106549 RepID=A0A540L9W5_MALBA|nr:hypothetical protein C1H46_031350 [Malus baccata]
MYQGRWRSIDPNYITYFPTTLRRQKVCSRVDQSWNPRSAAILKRPPHPVAIHKNGKSFPTAQLCPIPKVRDGFVGVRFNDYRIPAPNNPQLTIIQDSQSLCHCYTSRLDTISACHQQPPSPSLATTPANPILPPAIQLASTFIFTKP